jgi:acetyltransferase-like isoleucine patch superfamily enzyme
MDTVAISPAGDRSRRPPIDARPVEIEDDVWIGINATILKGVRISAGAVIAPGAVVTANVPAGCRVAGNPARIVDGEA